MERTTRKLPSTKDVGEPGNQEKKPGGRFNLIKSVKIFFKTYFSKKVATDNLESKTKITVRNIKTTDPSNHNSQKNTSSTDKIINNFQVPTGNAEMASRHESTNSLNFRQGVDLDTLTKNVSTLIAWHRDKPNFYAADDRFTSILTLTQFEQNLSDKNKEEKLAQSYRTLTRFILRSVEKDNKAGPIDLTNDWRSYENFNFTHLAQHDLKNNFSGLERLCKMLLDKQLNLESLPEFLNIYEPIDKATTAAPPTVVPTMGTSGADSKKINFNANTMEDLKIKVADIISHHKNEPQTYTRRDRFQNIFTFEYLNNSDKSDQEEAVVTSYRNLFRAILQNSARFSVQKPEGNDTDNIRTYENMDLNLLVQHHLAGNFAVFEKLCEDLLKGTPPTLGKLKELLAQLNTN